MPEEILENRQKRRPAWEIYIGVILGALLFGAIGYIAGSKNSSTTDNTTATPTVSTTVTASTSTTTDVTADWKTYTNDTYGFSFKYPNTWSEPQFTKQTNTANLPGSFYATSTGNGPMNLDPNKIFGLSFNSSDYASFFNDQITKQIDSNWTQQQFSDNIMQGRNGKLEFYKKLSSKAVLIGIYQNVECSESLGVNVLTPLNSKYPNLEISIDGKYSDDQTVKASQVAGQKNNDVCNNEAAYAQVAQKVLNGTFSSQINDAIQTATKIADSVQAK